MPRRTIEPFAIFVDQRDKLPYTFAAMHATTRIPFEVRTTYLKTGDYQAGTVEGGPEKGIVIERKSLADLYGTLGQHRQRFEREMERMQEFRHKAIVVEADLVQIATWKPPYGRLHGRSVIGTLIAWAQRYDVHVHGLPNRKLAEQFVFRMLERWALDQRKYPVARCDRRGLKNEPAT